jgi:hypothetical protein
LLTREAIDALRSEWEDGDDPTHLARPPGPPAKDVRLLDLCREVAPMRFRAADLRPHGWGSGRVSKSSGQVRALLDNRTGAALGVARTAGLIRSV